MIMTSPSTALMPARGRAQLDSRAVSGSDRSVQKRWQPPEGLSPTEVQAVIEAATSELDRLLPRVRWATGGAHLRGAGAASYGRSTRSPLE
jgi:hypothetical protein